MTNEKSVTEHVVSIIIRTSDGIVVRKTPNARARFFSGMKIAGEAAALAAIRILASEGFPHPHQLKLVKHKRRRIHKFGRREFYCFTARYPREVIASCLRPFIAGRNIEVSLIPYWMSEAELDPADYALLVQLNYHTAPNEQSRNTARIG